MDSSVAPFKNAFPPVFVGFIMRFLRDLNLSGNIKYKSSVKGFQDDLFKGAPVVLESGLLNQA